MHEIRVDLHSHTWQSSCGLNTHLEMAEAAAMMRLDALAITDHGPSHGGSLRRNFLLRFDGQWKGTRILRGIEANITDTGTDVPEALVPRFEVILAGLHIGGPCHDVEKNTAAVLRAFTACPWIDAFTHPFARAFPIDLDRVVSAAVRRGIAMELNNSTLALRRCDFETARSMLALCRETDCRVAVGSDAHSVSEVGHFEAACAMLEEMRFPQELIVNRTLETTLLWLDESRKRKMSGSSPVASPDSC